MHTYTRAHIRTYTHTRVRGHSPARLLHEDESEAAVDCDLLHVVSCASASFGAKTQQPHRKRTGKRTRMHICKQMHTRKQRNMATIHASFHHTHMLSLQSLTTRRALSDPLSVASNPLISCTLDSANWTTSMPLAIENPTLPPPLAPLAPSRVLFLPPLPPWPLLSIFGHS